MKHYSNIGSRTGRSTGFSLALLTATLLVAGLVVRSDDATSLKDAYKNDFYVGVAINRGAATGQGRGPGGQIEKDVALVKQQYNQIVSENDMKWDSIQPREGKDGYNFGPADAFVDFGLKNNMYIVGHTLVWHSQTPNWVFAGTVPPPEAPTPPGQTPAAPAPAPIPGEAPPQLPAVPGNGAGANRGGGRFGRGFGRNMGYNGPRATRDELLARMRDHIHTVVGRYKGKVQVWDVVNEAISDGGPNVLRNSLWLQIIGPDFIAKAFEYAHEADPDAILRYNDYGLENPAKRQKLITLIKELLALGWVFQTVVVRSIRVEGSSPTSEVIRRELRLATSTLLGAAILQNENDFQANTLIIGTPQNSPLIRNLNCSTALQVVGDEGFLIRSARVAGKVATVIASNSEVGALYGTFHLLRLMQTGQPIDRLNISQRPALQLRLMNHWDNPDGTIERGYGGRSMWQWDELPEKLSPRYTDYARANASIGINGAVVNNVNADPRILSGENLRKVAALANVWRPYGVRLYLSANFAAPVRLGGLTTADPLDPKVIDWWKAKADEIYTLIPDFGGFLVKANSEGQPGPKTYGRTHADGANVLADALAPHGGNVIWRAFVYDDEIDPDRAKRAYIEFTRLDGQFRPNVVVQVKNGAIDFQPREPFHPLFGALKQTPVIAEIQASQEYLGQAKHLVYLGTMWEEFLRSDTHAKGPGSTVAKLLAGQVVPSRITGLVSVTNPGMDENWCGHHFSQSNWYAFGRLAWNPELAAETIADEWTRMTFTNEEASVKTIRDMMMSSHETFVNYTMPLGLHHLIDGNHYAPQPWNNKAPRPDWTATYYHQSSLEGIGYDRTRRGNHAVEQYFPAVRDTFDNITSCPEKYLLWFHRCDWDYRMKSGKTLWDELCIKYDDGARQAQLMQATWQALEGKIDARRHREVAEKLAIQAADSAKWRDQILKYFAQFSKRPVVKMEA